MVSLARLLPYALVAMMALLFYRPDLEPQFRYSFFRTATHRILRAFQASDASPNLGVYGIVLLNVGCFPLFPAIYLRRTWRETRLALPVNIGTALWGGSRALVKCAVPPSIGRSLGYPVPSLEDRVP